MKKELFELKIPYKRSPEELKVLSKVVRIEVLSQYYKELVDGFGNNKQSLEGG